MSATLDIDLFARYFSPSPLPSPPCVEVRTRTHPVKAVFLNELLQAPELTGPMWDYHIMNPLSEGMVLALSQAQEKGYPGCPSPASQAKQIKLLMWLLQLLFSGHPNFDLDGGKTGVCVLVFLAGMSDIEEIMELTESRGRPEDEWLSTVEVVPLHSLIPEEVQNKAFEPLRSGMCRLVLATNIAESSVTIPGVKFVIDMGIQKVSLSLSLSFLLSHCWAE